MGEIFGRENLVSVITYRTKSRPLSSKNLETMCDHIIWYSKNISKIKYRQLFESKSVEGDKIWKWVELSDGTRRKMTNDEINNHKLLPKGSRVYRTADLRPAGFNQNCVYDFEFEGRTYSPPGNKCWITTKERLQILAEKKYLQASGNVLERIIFLDDYPISPLTNLWSETVGASEKIYVVQTSENVIAKCLLMSTDPGDVVLDPTCGSGTTAFVAEQWGRRWITCDTSRVAVTLAKQRLMTSKFDYYSLAHPDEGLKSGFQYKTVPHITLGSIANNEPSQTETLYDQPIINREKIRVSGPFTVEAVPSLRTKPFDGNEARIQLSGTELARSGFTSHLYQWIDELKATGIRATGGKLITFGSIEPTPGMKYLHAEAEMLNEQGEMQRAVISFGPDYGPIEQRQVEEAVKEAKKLKDRPLFIIFAAFHFDPEAAKDIDQINNSKSEFTLLKAQMSVDLLTHDLRKKRSSNQSYWLIGQPDVEITKGEKDTYIVKVNGFDYYNPVTGEIESGSNKQIAMWMLDTDYDEQSILPDQIFFPMGDSKRDWTKLAKALNGTVDEDLLELFTGTTSKPFIAGENKKIAVKIIDNRGIESFVVKSL